MKKENITQFDLESAFKALDEIDIPKVRGGVRPNKTNFSESVKRVDRLSMLLEDYYDVQDEDDLQKAAEDREGEIAKAKLSRIEKIVDLDANSTDEILPSYVGKDVIQCPQCMTLFYKSPEDIVASDEDAKLVNIGEKCQHCGNEDGYTLIGKIAEETLEELVPEAESDDLNAELPADMPVEPDATADTESEFNVEPEAQASEEMPAEETENPEETESEEKEDEDEEKLTEEFDEKTLTEEKDNSLNQKIAEHNDLIDYLQKEIEEIKKELQKAKNDEIKDSMEKRISALEQDLEDALPDAIKDAVIETNDLPNMDELEADVEAEAETETEADVEPEIETKVDDETKPETKAEDEVLKEAIEKHNKTLMEKAKKLGDIAIDQKMVDDMWKAYDTTCNPTEIESILDSGELSEEVDEDELIFADVEELQESTFNSHVTKFLTEVYENVNSFEATNCETDGDKLIVEGNIQFKSGNDRKTRFEFTRKTRGILEGYNEDFSSEKAFKLYVSPKKDEKVMLSESLEYNFKIHDTVVSGHTKE